MMITRDTDGSEINRIFNHPTVRWAILNDDQQVDLSNLVRDRRVYALIGDPPLGGYLAWQILDGCYELHTAVLPEGRGEWTKEFSEAAIRYMFVGSNAIELMTRIPQGALGSLTLARMFGFTPRWSCPECEYRGKKVPYIVHSLTMFDWFPADETARSVVLRDMVAAGQGEKARNWQLRWAALSTTVLETMH